MGSQAHIIHEEINQADYDHIAHWRVIWVDPAHQGIGLGAYLYAEIDTEARRLGKEKIVLYLPTLLASNSWFTDALAFAMEGGDVSTGAGYRDLTTTGGIAVPPLPDGYSMRIETGKEPPTYYWHVNNMEEYLKNTDTTKYIVSYDGQDVGYAYVDY